MAELDRLFCAHHVLSFPRQQLNEGELLAFAGRWGELVCHPYNQRADHREMLELTNRGKRRNPNEHWHSDMSYNSAPPKLTMLYAVEAPEIGGDTAFANQHLAYAELSDGMRELIGDLRAVHTGEGLAGLYGEDPREAPRAEHPVVRTHDQTGERALYVCRAFTSRFVGMKTTESRGLLEYLFEHSARPDFQGRHHWRAGDVVMWDNRSVLHYAVHDHGDDPRSIWRVQVEGPVPT
jgi:taurine dioxygenase